MVYRAQGRKESAMTEHTHTLKNQQIFGVFEICPHFLDDMA